MPQSSNTAKRSCRLSQESTSLEVHSDRLWIEIWTETRNISRRILTIERHATGVLDCTVQRFGGRPGKLSFLDLDRPQTAHRSLFGLRSSFAEQFRRMLFRQFPGWEILSLSCGLDLQRSFSSVFPRARLGRGHQQIAATGLSQHSTGKRDARFRSHLVRPRADACRRQERIYRWPYSCLIQQGI